MSRTIRVLMTLVLGIVALQPIIRFLDVAFSRIRYPFELEWMEGGVVDHIRIVLSGQALYRAPSLDFTPFIYVPGYYYVSALVTKIVGLGLFAPRLVSLVSILGCFALLGLWVYKESENYLAAVVAVGLFAATFGQSAFWFDLARVDSLFLFFLLAGYCLARFGTSWRDSIVCGLLLGCAALTKQIGLVLAVPALGFIVLQAWKRGLWAFVAFAAFVATTFGLLEVTSHGWFSYYTFRVPAEHEVFWPQMTSVLTEQFWTPVAPMTLAMLAIVFGTAAHGRRSVWAFHASWALCALGASLSSILHTGGYPNVLMPAHAAMAMCGGLVFSKSWQTDSFSRPLTARLLGHRLFVAAVLVIQLVLLPKINRRELVPSAEDRAAGKTMLAAVAASRGPVWMISSGYYPYVARGDGVTSHAMALTDVFKAKESAIQQHLRDNILEQIRAKRFGTIVLDRAAGFLPGDIADEIRRNYRLKEHVFSPDTGRFWPKSGASIRPDEIWEPVRM
jgi:hypothetical protein